MPIPLPALRALRHRNFRLFIWGQAFALVGYWMQSIAQSWLLYKMTDSATLLGVLGFASSLPILLLSPLAGIWTDRCNLHKVMFATQILEMAQAITLATLALTGNLEPWHIIGLSMMMGVWLGTSFTGNFIAGYLGSFWSTMDKDRFFLMIAIVAALAGCAILLFVRPLQRVLKH